MNQIIHVAEFVLALIVLAVISISFISWLIIGILIVFTTRRSKKEDGRTTSP